MRKKKFSTSNPAVVKSAIARGYKIVSMAYWIGNPARTFFLEKQNYQGNTNLIVGMLITMRR